MTPPKWLEWAREIQAIAQTGLHYAQDEYNHQRYQRLMNLAAEIVSAHAELSYPSVLAAFNTPSGYSTPRVDVRGAVFLEDRILLVRECRDGGWTLPGGWADVGELPSHATEREVWEEAGYHVKASKLIGIYDANHIAPLELFHAYKIIFLCELIGGEARPSYETSEIAFFGHDELPEVFSGERTSMRHILDAFASHENDAWASVFD